MRSSFQALKDNAKRRGKSFELTFEQFSKFAIETDYIKKKGRSKQSYTIDREDETKGYTIDNIRVLPNSDNTAKGNRWRKILRYHWNEEENKMEFTTTTQKPIEQGDGPF